MKKYVVETYYTCTFKTVHTLNNLDDAELSKIDKRTDGEVEVIDVKLNNRKTKKIGAKKDEQPNNLGLEKILPNSLPNQLKSSKNEKNDNNNQGLFVVCLMVAVVIFCHFVLIPIWLHFFL